MKGVTSHLHLDLTRQVIEDDLDDIEDLQAGTAALKDPADPVLGWLEVRDALLAADEANDGREAGVD